MGAIRSNTRPLRTLQRFCLKMYYVLSTLLLEGSFATFSTVKLAQVLYVMELSVNNPIHLHKIGLLPELENNNGMRFIFTELDEIRRSKVTQS